jgi:hypothetical protein
MSTLEYVSTSYDFGGNGRCIGDVFTLFGNTSWGLENLVESEPAENVFPLSDKNLKFDEVTKNNTPKIRTKDSMVLDMMGIYMV